MYVSHIWRIKIEHNQHLRCPTAKFRCWSTGYTSLALFYCPHAHIIIFSSLCFGSSFTCRFVCVSLVAFMTLSIMSDAGANERRDNCHFVRRRVSPPPVHGGWMRDCLRYHIHKLRVLTKRFMIVNESFLRDYMAFVWLWPNRTVCIIELQILWCIPIALLSRVYELCAVLCV